MFVKIVRIVIALFSAFLVVCSAEIAGGGTETSNGYITVKVAQNNIEVHAKEGLKVWVFDTNYTPLDTSIYNDTALVDNDENVQFAQLSSGFYNVIAWDKDSGKSVIVKSVQVPGSTEQRSELKASSIIAGRVLDSEGAKLLVGTAFIKGTPYKALLDSTGLFQLNNVPSSSHRVNVSAHFIRPLPPLGDETSDTLVSVVPGQKVTVDITISQ